MTFTLDADERPTTGETGRERSGLEDTPQVENISVVELHG